MRRYWPIIRHPIRGYRLYLMVRGMRREGVWRE